VAYSYCIIVNLHILKGRVLPNRNSGSGEKSLRVDDREERDKE
jgi:hypothetical protein